MEDLLTGAHVVTLPMRVRFRGTSLREVVLLRGPAGWGEFGAFPEYDDDEAAWWLASGIEAAWLGWPEPLRHSVVVNATVPAVPPDEVGGVLARFPGCATAKVKVAEPGQTTADDVARVGRVRALLGPSARVRVDANGAWDVDTALDALTALARHGLDYAEQPCASLEELRRLRLALAARGVDVRLAADESIRKADDPFRVAAAGCVDLAVVKVAPLGGVRRTLAVADRLRAEHGLPVVVSSALDSGIGITAGLAAAAALDDEPAACGLATTGLLVRDVLDPPLVPHGGRLPVGAREPSAAALAELAAPAERRDWWLDRLARCHAVLECRAGSTP